MLKNLFGRALTAYGTFDRSMNSAYRYFVQSTQQHYCLYCGVQMLQTQEDQRFHPLTGKLVVFTAVHTCPRCGHADKLYRVAWFDR